MTIDYGKVENYIEHRGFGFVSHTFARYRRTQEVFFHIKVVRKTHPGLAQVLDRKTISEDIYFWYEYKTSAKGEEVVVILDVEEIRQKHADNINHFISTIREAWTKVECPLSESLRAATFDLLALDEANHLAERRELLEAAQKERQNERRLAEAARLQEVLEQRAVQQRAEAARQKAIENQRISKRMAEEEEFRQLVAEMSSLGFTRSSEVSRYIVDNRLGYKYKHISGILQMELDGEVWDFNGGFPPKIYARLCDALGLGNEGSRAIPREFTAYKDIFDY